MTLSIRGGIAAPAGAAPGAITVHPARQTTELASPPRSRLRVLTNGADAARPSRDWICFDEITLSPVVDSVSRHLYVAQKALHDRDDEAAVRELRTAAAELKVQAVSVAKRAGAAACIDPELAQIASWRLAAVAVKLEAAAHATERKRFNGRVELSVLVDVSMRTDIERRWLVADEGIWYPVCAEAERHLRRAIEAYAKQSCAQAVIDIHKATGYLRLEAGRAAGYAKRALDGAGTHLGKAALSVLLGQSRGRGAIAASFSVASLSLAVAHHVKAVQWWMRGTSRTAGYELAAAARCLDSAAEWTQCDGATGAIKEARLARLLGERLIVGDSASPEQITDGIVSFSRAIEALGLKITSANQPTYWSKRAF